MTVPPATPEFRDERAAMNGSGAGSRSALDRRRRRALLALGGVGLAAVLVAVTVWSSGPPSGPGPTPPSSQGSPISSPSTSPVGASDPNEPWGELAVAPIQPVATLTATKIARAGVAADTAFTLASIDGGDFYVATSGDFLMATDSRTGSSLHAGCPQDGMVVVRRRTARTHHLAALVDRVGLGPSSSERAQIGRHAVLPQVGTGLV